MVRIMSCDASLGDAASISPATAMSGRHAATSSCRLNQNSLRMTGCMPASRRSRIFWVCLDGPIRVPSWL